MDKPTRKTLLANFVQINKRADVDSRVIDLCAAYARQCLKSGKAVNFYDPEPTLDQLLESAALSAEQKDSLKRFSSRQLELGIDERVIRLCIAYAGNLMLQGAAVIFDGQHLAGKLGYPYQTLAFLSSDKYKCSKGYVSLQIPKRSGGLREIDAPRCRLKTIQRWILDNILAEVSLHDAVHGFRVERSILSNTKPHVGKELVIKLDLKDFFPTITFPRVLGVYLDIGYAYNVALLLTRLTTYKGRLPQGAPTSPALSNLVCRKLDGRLSGIADRMGYTYTRYADDISFSTSSTDVRPDKLIHLALRIVAEEGFECPRGRLCVRRKGTRQLVTGLVVNRKVSVPREERRRLRAVIHNCRTKGLESQNRDNCPYFLERLKGQVGFVMGVDTHQGERLRHDLDGLVQS